MFCIARNGWADNASRLWGISIVGYVSSISGVSAFLGHLA